VGIGAKEATRQTSKSLTVVGWWPRGEKEVGGGESFATAGTEQNGRKSLESWWVTLSAGWDR